MDSNQAAEYVEFLTLALAVQPYKAQVSSCLIEHRLSSGHVCDSRCPFGVNHSLVLKRTSEQLQSSRGSCLGMVPARQYCRHCAVAMRMQPALTIDTVNAASIWWYKAPCPPSSNDEHFQKNPQQPVLPCPSKNGEQDLTGALVQQQTAVQPAMQSSTGPLPAVRDVR